MERRREFVARLAVAGGNLQAEICVRLSHNLSREEWQHYLGNESYRPTCPQTPVPGGDGGLE